MTFRTTLNGCIAFGLYLGVLALLPAARADEVLAPVEMPADYYAETPGLSYDEELIEAKQETGWHWKEFRYTSSVFDGEPTRVHAVYAAPDNADKDHRVPGIIMTHGVFGAIRGADGRYWGALSTLVKAGYAVLFFDWYPDFAHNAKPDQPITWTTFGKLDYFGLERWMRRGGDFKESVHYQAMMAGRRGVSWLSTQSEVDAQKIGVTGASYGGIFSSLLAAIDPRIKAAAPAVYTSGFGLKEEGYNALPSGWSEREAQAWRNRFDSEGLLAKRKIPILYTVGANDSTFSLTKAMQVFAAMNEPKHLLIGPNRGHDYWDFEQTILFFDHALKNQMPRSDLGGVLLQRDGGNARATVKVKNQTPAKVEISFASVFEIDPDQGVSTIPADVWKWQTVQAKPGANGEYSATFPLPVMRPVDAREKFYDWGNEATWKPVATYESRIPAAPQSSGSVQAFARVTDQFGAIESTPLAAPLAFDDPKTSAPSRFESDESAPSLTGAIRVKDVSTIVIHPEVEAGKSRATLPFLAQPEVGKFGYVLWNWRKQAPATDLKIANVATPTKQIFAPFEDSVPATSFVSQPGWASNSRGGVLNFQINGVGDELVLNRAWRGSLAAGNGAAEEILLRVTDDTEHLATLVLGATAIGECNVRVSLRDEKDRIATARFRHGATADEVLQFRFRGNAHLKIQIASQPKMQYNTLVGPSALFLD